LRAPRIGYAQNEMGSMSSQALLRLTTVVCVDVVGYSARTEADASAAAGEILAMRERLAALAAKNGGRIFSTGGDSVLMEFAAARQAVIAICEVLDQRAAGEPDVRIGAHLGDVTVATDGDLLGHGVNVAARLAAVATAGRALISRELKAAAVGVDSRPMVSVGEVALAKMQTRVEAFEISPAGQRADNGERPSSAKVQATTLAVLPFASMSADKEQDYLSDGLTEDIITDLSRWRTLSVASRNSTFRYKGKPVQAVAVGRELGVSFVVEGSVRRIGDRFRISVQLVDAQTGTDVWAERFDRPAAELFDVQDEMVRTIVGTLASRVHATEAERLRRKPPTSLAAYEHTLRGNWLNWTDPATNAEARAAFKRAIELDPNYGLPHSLLAVMLRLDWVDNLDAPDRLLDEALHLARRGVELAETENASHMALAYVHLYRREFDSALHRIERALELNPANARNLAEYGMMMPFLGRPDVAFSFLAAAGKSDPYFGPHWYWHSLGVTHFTLQKYAEAVECFDRSGTSKPRTVALIASCHAKLGETQAARPLVESIPEASIAKLVRRLPYKQEADQAHLAECLTLAGFPDERSA
jgi:adenylate cyclase